MFGMFFDGLPALLRVLVVGTGSLSGVTRPAANL